MSNLAIVACSKTKLDRLEGAAPAARLYSPSQLFTKSYAYARAVASQVYILSAKYRLVPPQKQLEPYELTIDTMSPRAREEWTESTRKLLEVAIASHRTTRIIWLAGAAYIRPEFTSIASVEHEFPLAGKQIGERLQWLNANIPDDVAEAIARGEVVA